MSQHITKHGTSFKLFPGRCSNPDLPWLKSFLAPVVYSRLWPLVDLSGAVRHNVGTWPGEKPGTASPTCRWLCQTFQDKLANIWTQQKQSKSSFHIQRQMISHWPRRNISKQKTAFVALSRGTETHLKGCENRLDYLRNRCFGMKFRGFKAACDSYHIQPGPSGHNCENWWASEPGLGEQATGTYES